MYACQPQAMGVSVGKDLRPMLSSNPPLISISEFRPSYTPCSPCLDRTSLKWELRRNK